MGSELTTRHNAAPSRLDDSLFSKDLAPHYMGLATKLASSELVPKCFRGKPQDLYIAWAMGYQIGIAPEQAMQCIAVINGKPAMWGDDMLALCMAHPDFEDIIEEPIAHESGRLGVIGYRCTVKRYGMEPKSNEFTLEMAKRAGLLSKVGPWTQYPERMLKLRARGFTLRDAFPDALKGIKPREEVEDYTVIDMDGTKANGSRTVALVADIKSREESTDEVGMEDSGLVESEEDKSDRVPAVEMGLQPGQLLAMGGTGEGAAEAYITITRLIEETGFTEERLAKALNYYEVGSIEELALDKAQDFITKLEKRT